MKFWPSYSAGIVSISFPYGNKLTNPPVNLT
jgi:hypothetical protein